MVTKIAKLPPTWSPKMMSTWLYQQDFSKFSLDRHYNLEVTEELGIAQSVISRLWQRFQDDGNVIRCYSTGHHPVTTPNEDRHTHIWQLLPKETDGAQQQTCLVSSLQLPVR
ncbi:uncharacterized protein TNCV_4952051 [Trichonephila clavipes]|nr:uncharacterized protein TNCV_4952051 [Trichonephila clavipes]